MKTVLLFCLLWMGFCWCALPVSAQTATSSATVIRPIFYPTEKTVPLSNDFGQARSGHSHEGNDLIGTKMVPLYAAVTGRVQSVENPEASWGYEITLEDQEGYTYHYLHVNNDTPGTDDGAGGIEHAYAPGIVRGAQVTAGQLVGWMGDSGNAEAVGAHLHFEIRTPDDRAIDPYPSLLAARNAGKYLVTSAQAESPDINTDKGLAFASGTAPCLSGSLVKSVSSTAVYYCGANGKRYAFPNERVYFSWYANFNTVQTLTNEGLAAIPLGGNVTYRPGIKLVKIPSLPNVYAVQKGGVLRWIQTSAQAASLYGKNWNKNVDDISEAYFVNYTVGDPV